jgi:hypothetical protein
MQVSAYKIASLYGIDALSHFWTINNEMEIQQARADWEFIQQDLFILAEFNDGNEKFEVIYNRQDLEAFNSQTGADVTKSYQIEIVKILLKIDDIYSKFDMPRTALVGFLNQ